MTRRSQQQLQTKIEKQTSQWKKAEAHQHSALAYMSQLSAMGLMFILPIIAGAYLGHWIDDMSTEYSIRWTLSLIFLGLLVGVFNVYLLINNRL